ncbi:AbrB/MazE/SpoVT family DNA-binding domain-containing protein [archaeon]|nr:AbrB/MazE/SpoVT family DNA-binding domain-containing protein [archaeon]
MRRKVISQKDSVTMTLPKRWVSAKGIKAGDEIEVRELPEGLLVSADTRVGKRSTSISITSLTESAIRTMITNAYRLGYDIITVSFRSEEQFRILDQVVKTRLLGFEIIRREKNSCVIESITEPSPDQFEALSKKLLYNISELFGVLMGIFDKKDVLVDVEETESKIQQYNNFCCRIVSKRLVDMKNSHLFWSYQSHVIHAQREIYFILRLMMEGKVKPDLLLRGFAKDCAGLFEDLKQAYLKRDIVLMERIQDAEKTLVYKKGYSLLQKSKEKVIVYHLMGAIRNFYQATSPLIGLSL